VAVLGLGGAVLVAGCSTTSSSIRASVSSSPSPRPSSSAKASPSSSAPASASPAASKKVPCKEINSLRTSLTSLTHTSISPTSAGTLTKDLKNIQTQLTALKGQAGGAFSSQAQELTSSVDQIKTASRKLSSDPMGAIRQLTTSLNSLKTKAKPVIAEMNAACPKAGKS
jgi:uncharacterized phage infection (PIP) family protein YhgE